jgi:hypothetical protein
MLTMYFYLSYQGGVERDMSVAAYHMRRMQFPSPFVSDASSRSIAGYRRSFTAFLLTLLTIGKGNVLTRVIP